jgi:hypothetical protein
MESNQIYGILSFFHNHDTSTPTAIISCLYNIFVGCCYYCIYGQLSHACTMKCICFILVMSVLSHSLHAAERTFFTSLKSALSRKHSSRKYVNRLHNTQILKSYHQSEKHNGITLKYGLLPKWKRVVYDFIVRLRSFFYQRDTNGTPARLVPVDDAHIPIDSYHSTVTEVDETEVIKVFRDLTNSEDLIRRSRDIGMALNEELVHRYFVASQWTGRYHGKR